MKSNNIQMTNRVPSADNGTKPHVGGSTVKELMKLRDQFTEDLLADAELGAALYILEEVSKNEKCLNAPDGYSDEFSPQVFVCIQSIIRCKRRLRKSILKTDKVLLANAKARLQKYFPTVDRDEQIKILKFVQPEPRGFSGW